MPTSARTTSSSTGFAASFPSRGKTRALSLQTRERRARTRDADPRTYERVLCRRCSSARGGRSDEHLNEADLRRWRLSGRGVEWTCRARFSKTSSSTMATGTRSVRIAGYLLSQVRPSVDWSGLTARVQNVAVEERSFFDLESDPGFRKYITGEVWLLGEVDRARLDQHRSGVVQPRVERLSSGRTSDAGGASAIQGGVRQAPQRAKVAIKRRLDQQVAIVEAARQTERGGFRRGNGNHRHDRVSELEQRLVSVRNGPAGCSRIFRNLEPLS